MRNNLPGFFSLALALLPLTTLVGCEEIQPYLPTVSFDRLDVLDVDWGGIDSDFIFNVNNPNPVDIDLATFDYALEFADVEWITGDSPEGFELSASGDSELPLNVNLEFQNLYDMVQAVRGEDDIDFGLSGRFGFDTPIGLVELPYNASGLFPAMRTPTVDLGKLETSINWSTLTANLDLNITLDNDHGSSLWFQNFDYDVKLVGSKVASGLIEDFSEVDGATTQNVKIPMEIDLTDVADAVYSAITGDTIEVEIIASTDVDTPFGVIPLSIDEAGTVDIY